MDRLFYPTTPIAYDGESAGSLITRLIQLNSYQHAAAIYKHLADIKGIEEFVSIISHDLKFASFLSKMRLDTRNSHLSLRRKSITQRSEVLWKNAFLPDKFFHNDLQHYCPLCLRDQEFWRKDWLLKLNYACPKHKVMLLNHCPHCFKKLNIIRSKLCICPKCQTDIRLAPIIACNTTQTIEWLETLFSYAEQDKINILINCFTKLEKFNISNNLNINNEELVNLTYAFLNNTKNFQNSINSILLNHLPNIHPRIALLPFLIKDRFIPLYKDFIKSACDQFNFSNITTHQGFLTIQDCCKVLNKSRNEIKHLITLNHLHLHKQKDEIYISIPSIVTCLSKYKELQIILSSIKDENYIIQKSEVFYTLKEAANCLNVNTETVRFLIKNHILSLATQTSTSKTTQHFISKKSLDEFHREKILIGAVARELNVNPTNLTEKLASLGIFPIHGPKVDQTRNNIFLKSSINHITREKILSIQTYPNSAGRKKHANDRITQTEDSLYIPLKEAAKRLEKSPLQVAQLVTKQFLKKKLSNPGNILINLESLDLLLEKISSPMYTHYEDALQLLNCPPNWFNTYWIKTEILKIEDLLYWKVITTADINRALKIRSEYLTGAEVSKLMNMHKSHIPNLSIQGLITPLLIGNTHKIKFYSKADVIYLIKKGYGYSSKS